jgi:hypothetical protein
VRQQQGRPPLEQARDTADRQRACSGAYRQATPCPVRSGLEGRWEALCQQLDMRYGPLPVANCDRAGGQIADGLDGGLRDDLSDIPGLRQRSAQDVLHCPYCHGYEVRDQPLGVLGGSPDAPALLPVGASVVRRRRVSSRPPNPERSFARTVGGPWDRDRRSSSFAVPTILGEIKRRSERHDSGLVARKMDARLDCPVSYLHLSEAGFQRPASAASDGMAAWDRYGTKVQHPRSRTNRRGGEPGLGPRFFGSSSYAPVPDL